MGISDRGAGDVVEPLRGEAGDALRVVATYDEDGYDTLYVRDDAADRVEQLADGVHEELVLQGLGRDHLEDLFGAGDLQCSMHCFEDVTGFHFATGEFSGLFVSLDPDADVSLASFVDTCRSVL